MFVCMFVCLGVFPCRPFGPAESVLSVVCGVFGPVYLVTYLILCCVVWLDFESLSLPPSRKNCPSSFRSFDGHDGVQGAETSGGNKRRLCTPKLRHGKDWKQEVIRTRDVVIYLPT